MTWMTNKRAGFGAIILAIGAALAVLLFAGCAGANDAEKAAPDDFTVSKIQFTHFGRDGEARTTDKAIFSNIGGENPKARIRREGGDYVDHELSAEESGKIAALVWALRDRPAVPNGFKTDLAQFGLDGAERYTLSMRPPPSQEFNNFVLNSGDGDLDPNIVALTNALIEIGGFAYPPGEAPQPAMAEAPAPKAAKPADVPASAPEPVKVSDKKAAKEEKAEEPGDSGAPATEDSPVVTAGMYAKASDVEIRRFEFNLVGRDDAGKSFRRGRIFISEFGEDNPILTVHDAHGEADVQRKLTVEEARRIMERVRALQSRPSSPKRFSTDLTLFGLDQAFQYNLSLSLPPRTEDFLDDFTIQEGEGYVDPDAAAMVNALLEIGGFIEPGEGASSGEIAEVSAADPVVEYCERDRGGVYYDCQCVGDRAGEARAEIAEKQNANEIAGLERQLEQLQSMKAKFTDNPSRLEGFEKNIAIYEERLAKAKNTPLDLASVRSTLVMKHVADLPACRARAGTYERSFDGCMSSTNADESAASRYCECVANNTADAWVGAENPAMSIRNLGVRARGACADLAP